MLSPDQLKEAKTIMVAKKPIKDYFKTVQI